MHEENSADSKSSMSVDGSGHGSPMVPVPLEWIDESKVLVAAIDHAEVGIGTITCEIRGHAFDSTGNRRSILANETFTVVD